MTHNHIENTRPFAAAPPVEAVVLAAAGWPILLIYAAAQTALCIFVFPDQPGLKLVVEPYLLLLGLILHVHWRRVTWLCEQVRALRRWWITLADCVSFVITFWAVAALAAGFVESLR